jgi:hypothetical protein
MTSKTLSNKKSLSERTAETSFTGETCETTTDVPRHRTVEDHAQRINASWADTIGQIFKTARYCKEADASLPPNMKAELMKLLNFSKSAFSKLVAIGRSKNWEHIDHQQLPAHYSILYELSRMSASRFSTDAKAGRIHPKLGRDEAMRLAGYVPAKSSRVPKSSFQNAVNMGLMFRSGDMSDDEGRRFCDRLQELRQEFEFEVVQNETLRDRECARRQKQALKTFQAKARRKVRDALRWRIEEKLGRKVRNVRQPHKILGFAEEECTLDRNPSIEDIKFVFGIIDIEDDFEELEREYQTACCDRDWPQGYDGVDLFVEEAAEPMRDPMKAHREKIERWMEGAEKFKDAS